MTARGLGRAAARLSRALDASTAKERATAFARHLRAEYEAGKAGDDSDVEEVTAALRSVDWAKVRAADTAQAMKAMAAEVDWSRVQPVAAKVSSALIAAVASGQLGVGGRLAGPVARAIINDRDLGGRISAALARDESAPPPDFRKQMGIIEATATE